MNFTGETGTVDKNKKTVDNWLFCEGVVDNIGNPTSHPEKDASRSHDIIMQDQSLSSLPRAEGLHQGGVGKFGTTSLHQGGCLE